MLLSEARRVGVAVTADGDKLLMRGPRSAGAVVAMLSARKAEVLDALAAELIQPSDLPPDWLFAWEERAAIMEYDGELPQAKAEAMALIDVIGCMRRAGEWPIIYA